MHMRNTADLGRTAYTSGDKPNLLDSDQNGHFCGGRYICGEKESSTYRGHALFPGKTIMRGRGTQLLRTLPLGMMETMNKILSYEPSQAAPFNLTSFFGTCGCQILPTSFAICQTSFLAEWSQDNISSSERTTTLLKRRHVFGHFEAMQCH